MHIAQVLPASVASNYAVLLVNLDLLHILFRRIAVDLGQLKSLLALVSNQTNWVHIVRDILAPEMGAISANLISASRVSISHRTHHPLVLVGELFV